MSAYLIAAPDLIDAAATDVASIGAALREAHTATTVQTVALVPAAADEVSTATAKLLSCYAQDYHSLAGQATGFHEHFVQHLKASARSYACAEAANATSLHASADSSAHSIAASKGLPPETPQSGPPLVNNAAWVLAQILNTSYTLEKLPLPAPLTHALALIWLLATLPIAFVAIVIILLAGGL